MCDRFILCIMILGPFSPLYTVSLMCLTNRRVDLGRVDDGADSSYAAGGKSFFRCRPFIPLFRPSQSNKISFLSGAAEDVTFHVEEDWRKDVRRDPFHAKFAVKSVRLPLIPSHSI